MSDVDRIMKGYKAKSGKRRYDILQFVLSFLAILRLKLIKR